MGHGSRRLQDEDQEHEVVAHQEGPSQLFLERQGPTTRRLGLGRPTQLPKPGRDSMHGFRTRLQRLDLIDPRPGLAIQGLGLYRVVFAQGLLGLRYAGLDLSSLAHFSTDGTVH